MTTSSRTAVCRLAVSRVISIGGGAAAYAALMFVIYERTGSPFWLSATLLLTFGAEGLLGPIGGLVGDRFNRKWVMVWSDLAGAACFFALALAHEPHLLLAIAFISAVAETPFWSASSAAIPCIAGEENLSRANALLTASRNLGVMLGPVLGGVMVASFGPGWVFVVNAVTFLFSAALVASVDAPFRSEESEEHMPGLWVGFRFLIHEKVLLTIMIAWTVLVLGMGMCMVADLPLVHSFGEGSVGYGVLIACWGGGAVLGTVTGRWMNARNEGLFLFAGTVVMAVGTALVFVSPWFAMAVSSVLIAGVGDAATVVAEEGIRQRRTPDAIRSRVISLSAAGWEISFAISVVVGGFAVEWIGAKAVYGVAGLLGGVAVLILLPVLRIARREAAVSQPPDAA